MSEYNYIKLINDLCDIYRYSYLLLSCFIVSLEFVVPAERHELRTIGLLLIFLAILIIENKNDNEDDGTRTTTTNIVPLFGNLLLLSSSLLNMVVTYTVLRRGKMYYALVHSSIRTGTVCGFASIWIVELSVIDESNNFMYLFVGMVWISCFILSIVKNYIQYQRMISADTMQASGGFVTSYVNSSSTGNINNGPNERNWHDWTANQVIAWIAQGRPSVACECKSRVLACVVPHSINGAMMRGLSIRDLRSFGLSYADAYQLYEDIQQLVSRNDGGFALKEKLRYKRYEYGSNFIDDENQVHDVLAGSPVANNQHSEKRNGEFFGISGVDMNDEKQLNDMHGRAAELMKSRFGMTLPSMIPEDAQADTALESSAAQEENVVSANEVEESHTPLTASSVGFTDQSRVPESSHMEYPMPSEALLASMPPEIRQIAQRHPSVVSKLLSQKSGMSMESGADNAYPDRADNSLSLLQKIQKKSRQFLTADDANGKKTDNTSPLFVNTDATDEEMQSLVNQQHNPALRRRTKR
mmetsp:Transcript_26791/g.41563  ORF Transcript_26791/g.41563 Transcript_26791/m.41563 type:complete len:527 (+) Transcript_26791:64-1644(+)